MKPRQTVTNEYGTFEAVEVPEKTMCGSCEGLRSIKLCKALPSCYRCDNGGHQLIFKQIKPTTENPLPE